MESNTSVAQPSTSPAESTKPLLPGATIGMVGGGQLGRMFAVAAASMGYKVFVFTTSADDPAAQVAHRVFVGELTDHEVAAEFASQCDVITLEFENIPADTIALCGEHAPTYPDASVLATAQDRLREKGTLAGAGLPVTPFAEVTGADSIIQLADQLGWPLIVKTATSGYDGKGQHRVESAEQARQTTWDTNQAWAAEKCIAFDCEVSVVVARSSVGEVKTFPVFENGHRNHILDLSVAPASVSQAVQERAEEIAKAAAETLGVVGLLCVEMFVQGDEVLINEVAPRPHNSGHLTIEACHTSQFGQHVRAICGMPLGETSLRCGAAAMVNLLGDLWDDGDPDWSKALAVPGACLHLYGKQDAKKGRKMGHLTATADTVDEAVKRAESARAAVQ